MIIRAAKPAAWGSLYWRLFLWHKSGRGRHVTRPRGGHPQMTPSSFSVLGAPSWGSHYRLGPSDPSHEPLGVFLFQALARHSLIISFSPSRWFCQAVSKPHKSTCLTRQFSVSLSLSFFPFSSSPSPSSPPPLPLSLLLSPHFVIS